MVFFFLQALPENQSTLLVGLVLSLLTLLWTFVMAPTGIILG
jgi:hypothetical protein